MLSLCITTYNRFEMTMESFAKVIDDDRISEIVIVDDCSEIDYYDKLAAATLDMPKVRLFRNKKNLGMSLNKKRAVELAKCEWVILFDSDNVIDLSYIDAVLSVPPGLSPDIIYCPDFAKPRFDYRKYAVHLFNSANAGEHISDNAVEMFFNTCNNVVNRAEYLRIYEHNPAMKGTDTIWFNYLWLKAGNSFYVVPGMQYEHRVHDGSGWLADANYNMLQGKKIKELIKAL